ncbi:POLX protein, partial [Pseudoatta argentina]
YCGMKNSISKFDSQNFQLWKFQVKTILLAHDFLDIIEGREAAPTALHARTKKDTKAKFILSSSMEYSQLEYLIRCSTAAEMWTKLSDIHEQKSGSNKLTLTTKFHKYRMMTGDSVAQHITKMKNMANQLKDIGEGVSDVMIMAKILGTLPTKYSAFISGTASHRQNKLCFPYERDYFKKRQG